MMHRRRFLPSVRGRMPLPLALAAAVAVFGPGTARASNSMQTNLVSDVPGLAVHTDSVLKNAWGLSHGPNTPFWVSDADTDLSTLYDGTGTPEPAASPLQVMILVLGEAILVGAISGLLSVALSYTVINKGLGDFTPTFLFVPPSAFVWGPGIGALTALAGSLAPAWSACTVKVSEVFARVA